MAAKHGPNIEDGHAGARLSGLDRCRETGNSGADDYDVGWMYLTPIIYPEEVLPESIRFWVTHLNPMYYMVNIYRIPTYYGRWPTGPEFLAALMIALVALIVGWIVFSNKYDEYAYRI